ncbi:AP2-associated kinase [Microdochium nivale]|nr:AP2-associated kinase [Microdochium nivale]
MSSHGHHAGTSHQRGQQGMYAASPQGQPVHLPVSTAPAGTFSPGTKIQVGEHKVVIQKYLSEGGFAHVYLVKMPQPVDGTDLAVLKRVAVPDKETLRGMRTEVETMKKLKGHRPIVKYIDSHASELKGGGYEVFLLMEFCNGGGLIDFMNTRLQHRLTEPEILNIFTDVAEGVACMHYLKPPLLHRDLKVENVLITTSGTRKKFKLCDFGSAAVPKPAPQTVVECRLVDEDVQRHTTLQYRSPEMIDVYRKQPIDEKSDIWALGVLLYKLCYYTTPFEDQGQLAIMNASYRFPSHPVFSDRLKSLIASMLRENQTSRPNIYQVLSEGCAMQGLQVPIHDIYSGRAPSDVTQVEQQRPSEQRASAKPVVGAVFSPPPQQTQTIPDITPMRRGRPQAASSITPSQSHRPSPSPARVTQGDPFAALDTKPAVSGGGDEVDASSRFPSLDQFSILHDKKDPAFDFETSKAPPKTSHATAQLVSDDDDDDVDNAFAIASAMPPELPSERHITVDQGRFRGTASGSPVPFLSSKSPSAPPKLASEMSRASMIISNNPELQAIASPPLKQVQSPPPRVPGVSGSMNSNTSPAPRVPQDYPAIHKFPPADQFRGPSVNRPMESKSSSQLRADASQGVRGPSPQGPLSGFQPPHPSSSRPSLEGGRPSADNLETLQKSSSSLGRPRPSSTYLESNLDYLREREAAPRPLKPSPSPRVGDGPTEAPLNQDDATIESNVDFLRSMEDPDSKIKKDKAGKHGKRGSLASLSGTKHILAGRLGDAFKRFESTGPGLPARTPSPFKEHDRYNLTPIEGSEATDGRSDDGILEAESYLTPEMRREREAQILAEEERRVEAAAAEYKQKVAVRASGGGPPAPLPKSIGGVSRAVSIQNRVQALLDESQKVPVQRTASGYGQFSDSATAASRLDKELPLLPRKPVSGTVPPRASTLPSDVGSAQRPALPPKPSLAPKPTHLNNIATGNRPRSPPKPQHMTGSGQPAGGPAISSQQDNTEDLLEDFSKRYPSLASIEMVEQDFGPDARGRTGR